MNSNAPRTPRLVDHAAAPWIALLVYAGALIWTLPDFAVTWDEPGWFDFGQDCWNWVLGDSNAPFRDRFLYFHYGTLPSMTAAASRWLLADRWGLLAADPARHLSNVGWTLIGVACLVTWAKSTLGTRGALLAVGSWALWVRLWPHAHNNISDMPGAAMSLWACWGAWRIAIASRPRLIDYALFGVLLGVAYSTRAPNVYFVGLAIALWAALDRLGSERARPSFSWIGIAVAFAVFMATVKAANPFLWHSSVFEHVFVSNPLAYLTGPIGKIPLWFRGQLYDIGQVPWYYAVWILSISTPLLLLGLLAVGGADIVRRGRAAPPHLTLWAAASLVAIAKHFGGSGNYAGVRHFAEAFGPLTLIAAHGSLRLLDFRRRLAPIRRHAIDLLIAIGIALPIWSASHIYPYLTGYFNPLAGTTEQAWRDYEADYWGQGVEEAARWIDLAFDPTPRTIYMPLAPNLMSRRMPARFEVIRLRKRGDQLERAASGSLLVLLNHKGLLRSRSLPDCPQNWNPLYEVGPEAVSTPAVMICNKP